MYSVYCIFYLFSGYHWVTPLPYFSPVLPSQWSCRSSCSSATSSLILLSLEWQPSTQGPLWSVEAAGGYNRNHGSCRGCETTRNLPSRGVLDLGNSLWSFVNFFCLLRCGSMPWPSTTPASIWWRALHQSRTSPGFSGLLPSRFLPQPSTSSPDRWNGVVKVSLNTDLPSQAKHVHYSVFVFWFGVSGLVVSTSGLCWANVMHNPFEVEIWDKKKLVH